MSVLAVQETQRIGNSQVFTAVFASCLGWALDLFDLFILLFVAPVVGKLFFPSTHPTLSLAAVYASFAVTLLLRPVGGAIFGAYADKHGRKKAMTISITGVGITTALFGALPTLDQIGFLAPVFFLTLRLVQGIFVGGVVATTHTVGTESVPPKWRGAVSGLVGGGGAGLGALLASVDFLIMSTLFQGAEFESWGWRFMFFSGILTSLLGFYIFRSLEESPLWARLKAAQLASAVPTIVESPVRLLFQDYFWIFLVNILVTIGAGAGYYVTSGYLPAFLKVINKVSNTESSLILIAGAAVAIIAGPPVGYLSDKIGRRKTLLGIGVLCAVCLPLLFMGMAKATVPSSVTFYALAIALLGNIGLAPVPIFLNERFPPALRATGTGLSWNVGFAIGGMSPTFVSLVSPTVADIPFSLSIFAAAAFGLYFLGDLLVSETKGQLA